MTEELAERISEELLGIERLESPHDREIARLALVPQAVFVLCGLPDPDDFLVDVPNRTVHILSGTRYIAVSMRRHTDDEGETHILEADARAVSLEGAAVSFKSELRSEGADVDPPAVVREWTFTPSVGDPVKIEGRLIPILAGPGGEDDAETFAESMAGAVGFTVGAFAFRLEHFVDDEFPVDDD